jgi:hypothetical protein
MRLEPYEYIAAEGEFLMATAGDVAKQFYDAAVARDLAEARRCLHDDLVFVGLFETYRSADDYIAAFSGLLQVTVRLDVKTIIAEGDEAAVFFELETRAPAEGIVLVAEWHQIKSGKIARVESAFDGRPFAAMFTGAAS